MQITSLKTQKNKTAISFRKYEFLELWNMAWKTLVIWWEWGEGWGRRDILLILSNLSSLLKRLFEVLISKLSKLVAFSLTIAFFGLLYCPFAGLLMTRQGKGE